MNMNFEIMITLNKIFCSNLSFSIGSTEEKLISLETALHLRIFFGTLASCSLSGNDLQTNQIFKRNIF